MRIEWAYFQGKRLRIELRAAVLVKTCENRKKKKTPDRACCTAKSCNSVHCKYLNALLVFCGRTSDITLFIKLSLLSVRSCISVWLYCAARPKHGRQELLAPSNRHAESNHYIQLCSHAELRINRSLTKSYETCVISPYVRPLFASPLLFLLP
jgi:hypothetical protein